MIWKYNFEMNTFVSGLAFFTVPETKDMDTNDLENIYRKKVATNCIITLHFRIFIQIIYFDFKFQNVKF